MELRVRQARERAEEQAYKQEIESAGNEKLSAIKDEQKAKDAGYATQKWAAELAASRLRPEWSAEKLVSGHVVAFGSNIKKSDAVTWMLWIKPQGTVDKWGNILLKGDSADDRSPMLSLYPGSTKLTVRSATTKNQNDGANPDPSQTLPVGKWTHVAFTHKLNELKVYFNTELVATTTDIQSPIANPGILYACGPTQTCANALIFDVRYFATALDVDHIAMVAQDSTAKMSAQVSSSSGSSQSGSASATTSGTASGTASATTASASSRFRSAALEPADV